MNNQTYVDWGEHYIKLMWLPNKNIHDYSKVTSVQSLF